MAKKSMINREFKRIRLVQKFAVKRKELKEIIVKMIDIEKEEINSWYEEYEDDDK